MDPLRSLAQVSLSTWNTLGSLHQLVIGVGVQDHQTICLQTTRWRWRFPPVLLLEAATSIMYTDSRRDTASLRDRFLVSRAGFLQSHALDRAVSIVHRRAGSTVRRPQTKAFASWLTPCHCALGNGISPLDAASIKRLNAEFPRLSSATRSRSSTLQCGGRPHNNI